MDRQILLSICIPTYNRAVFLDYMVRKLVSFDSFDDSVEIVISDNCSDDNTYQTVMNIMSDFPKKNIVYHRNEQNIKDKNFYKVLSLAHGIYRKLQNDYVYFEDSDLRHIKDIVKKHKHQERCSLFFYQQIFREQDDMKEVNTIDSFISTVHNKITWISNFGCFENQLLLLEKFSSQSNLQLLQMLWTLYLLENSNRAFIYTINTYVEVEIPNITRYVGTYNFFTPHVVNYYKILQPYKERGELTLITMFQDKNYLLKDFVGKSFMKYVLLREKSTYDLTGSWSIIFEHFWMIPRLYYIMSFKFLFKLVKRIF